MNVLFFSSRGPLANQKVRQAISTIIDRRTIADIVRGGGLIYPPTWLVPEKMGGRFTLTDAELLRTPGFRLRNNAQDPADIEVARRLFQEAGVDPASLNLVVIGVPQQADYTEALVTLLGKVGIKTTLQVVAATADRTARLLRNDFDIGTTGGGQTMDDPYDQIVNYVSSGGANNYGKLTNPELDKLLVDQEQTLDAAKRKDMVWDLQRKMLEWATFVPFAELTTVFGAQPYVENFPASRAFVVTSAHKFEGVWLNK
jgi:peptide/nickel transport system substrate-binding protein